jgi:hypothetical protein
VNNRIRIAESWRGCGVVLAMMLVTVALGFCVFDGDDHGQGCSLDLCLNTAPGSALLVGPLLEGWAADSSTVPVLSAWTTVLAPPPRSL